MSKNLSLRQETMLFIEYRTKKVVGIYQTFHKYIGLSVMHNLHGLGGSFIGSKVEAHRLNGTLIAIHHSTGHTVRSYEDEVGEPIRKRAADSFYRMVVRGAYYGHLTRTVKCFKMGCKTLKIFYRFHGNNAINKK